MDGTLDSIQHLWLFVAMGWILNLSPGPDVLYIVSNAMRVGLRGGVVAALGITAGCFVHVFAAALGVSAVLATSALAFTLLKYIGAAYLLYSGLRMLLAKVPSQQAHSKDSTHTDWGVQGLPVLHLRQIFLRGFFTNVLNPKVALFFLAFVPQFISAHAAHPTLTFLFLGLLFNVNSLPINIGYAVLAHWAMQRLDALKRSLHWLDRVAGTVFVGFGIKLAIMENPCH